MCLPTYAQALNILGWSWFLLKKKVWMNKVKAQSCGQNVQLFAFSRTLNPPVAFESPNPCRNVYRSALKTTPLTLKTAVIEARLCQKKGRKHKSAILVFPCIQPTCRLPGESPKLLKNASFQSLKTRYMSWLLHCVWLQSSFKSRLCSSSVVCLWALLAHNRNLKSTFLFHNLILLLAINHRVL